MAAPVVRIHSTEAGVRLTLLMGDTPPTLSGGEGGFDEVGRSRRKAFSEWTGHGLLRLDVSVVIDGRSIDGAGSASVSSVEAPIVALTRCGRSPKDFTRPPLCEVTGPAVPPQALEVESWVVTALVWGDAVRDDEGNRIRQEATITFTEYVEADTALSRNPIVTGRPGANYKLVPVGRFRTLPLLAKKYLKKPTRWKEIAKLNGIRGPKIPRKYWGKKIKVPLR